MGSDSRSEGEYVKLNKEALLTVVLFWVAIFIVWAFVYFITILPGIILLFCALY